MPNRPSFTQAEIERGNKPGMMTAMTFINESREILSEIWKNSKGKDSEAAGEIMGFIKRIKATSHLFKTYHGIADAENSWEGKESSLDSRTELTRMREPLESIIKTMKTRPDIYGFACMNLEIAVDIINANIENKTKMRQGRELE